MPPASTARVAFRAWTLDDVALAHGLWGDPRVTALIGGPFDEAWVRRRLATEIAGEAAHGASYWPIFDRDTSAHLGCCGVRPYAPGVLELGVHLRHDAGGRGLATEASRAVIDHAFSALGATALFAGHHPDNAASRRLLTKLGFVFTHDELYAPTGRLHPSYRLEPPRG
jgi:ribosomal-protein-alanine N-acetyltransferase